MEDSRIHKSLIIFGLLAELPAIWLEKKKAIKKKKKKTDLAYVRYVFLFLEYNNKIQSMHYFLAL